MTLDYFDESLGWRIQVARLNGRVEYRYTNRETGETIEGIDRAEAFPSPEEVIGEHIRERQRVDKLRADGLLGEQISRRIMEMVGELHKCGYESLYLDSVMAPHGMSWRYQIGAMRDGRWPSTDCWTHAGGQRCVEGSVGGGRDQRIPWADVHDTVTVLAEKFVAVYPSLVYFGSVRNREYAGWYAEMLRLTAPDGVLIFWCDYGPHYEYAFTWGGTAKGFRMPMPPGFVKRRIGG